MPAGVMPAARLVPMMLAGIVALAGTVRIASAYVPAALRVSDRAAEVETLEDRLAALQERERRFRAMSSELRSDLAGSERARELAQRAVRRLAREVAELRAEAAALDP